MRGVLTMCHLASWGIEPANGGLKLSSQTMTLDRTSPYQLRKTALNKVSARRRPFPGGPSSDFIPSHNTSSPGRDPLATHGAATTIYFFQLYKHLNFLAFCYLSSTPHLVREVWILGFVGSHYASVPSLPSLSLTTCFTHQHHFFVSICCLEHQFKPASHHRFESNLTSLMLIVLSKR